MDPREFFKTAAFLNGQKDEHHKRTSISRSYYAVHLYIRDFISNTFLGGIFFKTDTHKKILHCLQNCEAEEIKNLGVKLTNLLQARTDADYKMDKRITPTKSQDVYDDAMELLSDFDSKLAIPANRVNRQKFAKSSQQQARFAGILGL